MAGRAMHHDARFVDARNNLATISPDGARLAITWGDWTGSRQWVVATCADLDWGTRAPAVPRVQLGPFPPGTVPARLFWRGSGPTETIVAVFRGPDGARAYFVDPAQPAGAVPTMRRTSLPLGTSIGRGGDGAKVTAREHRSCYAPRDASGVYIAALDRIVFLSRPGLPPADQELPIDMRGRLSDIRYLEMPPWDRILTFEARVDGGAPAVHAMDTATGRSWIIGGPGGSFPAALSATQPAVSPVPEDP
jgi:hypothetical protein